MKYEGRKKPSFVPKSFQKVQVSLKATRTQEDNARRKAMP